MLITVPTPSIANQDEADVSRILVIDDDPAVRMTIKLVLERDGHAVELAKDGLAGMEAIKAGGIDLLIVDIFMPGMDGIETIREVHRHQPDLPAIVISGTSLETPGLTDPGLRAPDFLAMAVKLGAVRSLQKPFKPRDIIGAVRQCLGDAEAKSTGTG
jgi:CheY-like chemotaxis protein